MNDAIKIGPATAADAAALLEIHAAAVHQTAAPFYPPEIIHSWSRLAFTPERVEKVKERWIEDPEQYTVVARSGDRPVGFGFIGNNCELRALYVHPDFGRQGIGGQLIQALEQAALARGLSHLTAKAALNAQAFYQKQGFAVIEPTTFRLASGQDMPCIKMRKTLTTAPCE